MTRPPSPRKTTGGSAASKGRRTVQTPDYRIVLDTDGGATLDIAREIAAGKPWEPMASRVFTAHLRPGMRVVDIGANFGHFTLLAAAAVGPGGRVDAFEPEPSLHRSLEANLRLNGAVNARAHPLACGDVNGPVTLHRDRENTGAHSLAAANVATPSHPVRVRCVTLDGFISRTGGAPHLVKSDAQGAEAAIVRGALDTLRRHRPVLMLEYWPYGLKNHGDSAGTLLDTLAGLGYRFHLIDEAWMELRPISATELLAAYPETVDYAFANLLAVAGSGGPV